MGKADAPLGSAHTGTATVSSALHSRRAAAAAAAPRSDKRKTPLRIGFFHTSFQVAGGGAVAYGAPLPSPDSCALDLSPATAHCHHAAINRTLPGRARAAPNIVVCLYAGAPPGPPSLRTPRRATFYNTLATMVTCFNGAQGMMNPIKVQRRTEEPRPDTRARRQVEVRKTGQASRHQVCRLPTQRPVRSPCPSAGADSVTGRAPSARCPSRYGRPTAVTAT